jgi:ketosteroid isomerase-like protein
MNVDEEVRAVLDDIVELYNSKDLAAVVDRYWSNATVTVNGHTIATSGEEVLAGESAVLEAAPDRRLRITDAVASGRVVAVQAALSFTDRHSGDKKEIHWAAFWTFDEEGSITVDNAYFDPSAWPS